MDDKEQEVEQWTCARCTSQNHPTDRNCFQCLTPRKIAYPTVPENLPVPEIVNPFPDREFTNEQESFSGGVHTPRRREVLPHKMEYSKKDPTANKPQGAETTNPIFNPRTAALSGSEIAMEDMVGPSSMTMNFDPTNTRGSSDSSMQDLYDRGSPGEPNSNSLPPNTDEDIDSDEFRLPPLPDIEEQVDIDALRLPPLPGFAPVTTATTTAPVFSSSRSNTATTGSSSQLRSATVDDLLEQSAAGFQRSDFRQNSSTDLQNYGNNNAAGASTSNTPLDLTTQNWFGPPQTGFIQNTTISNLSNPTDIPDRSGKIQTGLKQNAPLSHLGLPPGLVGIRNRLEQPQAGLNWNLGDLKHPRIGLEAANPHIMAQNAMLNDVNQNLFPTPSVANLVAPTFSSGGQPPPLPKLSYPPGLTPQGRSGFTVQKPQDGTTAPSTSSEILKKVKPLKSNKPIPNLGLPKKERKLMSMNQIMSLFDPNGASEPMTSEPTPEVASVRSAVPVPPGYTPRLSQLDDPGFFDPYAPTPKPLNFKDEHFADDSDPVQEQSQNPVTSSQEETMSTSTSTTTVATGGARRKTPSTQAPTTITQTHLYAGPSTSRGPPPAPISLSGNGTAWPCPLCTFANRISAQYCEVCHDGRPPWYTGETMSPIILSPSQTELFAGDKILQHGAREAKSKAFVDDWVCQNCTDSNGLTFTFCQKCGSPKPSQFVPPSVSVSNPDPFPSIPSFTEPKRTQSVRQPERTPTNQQLAIPEPARRSTSQHHFSENLSSLTVLSVGSSTSSSTVKSIAMEQLRLDQEKSAMEIFRNIEAYCVQADDKFVDDQFLPTLRSLQFPNGRDPHLANAGWLRPHQVRSDPADQLRNWTVFCAEGPAATDIQQGILGNCWFLSGLSVLVERPQLLRKIFVTSEYSKYGAYMIRLCIDGVWQTVIIDDLLPCNSNGELLYTQAKRKQLWVPFIEKALAKVHGCYESLQAGRSIEGLATLTGAPCESLQLVAGPDLIEPEPDMIWVRLLSAREAGYLMGASCGGANMEVDETIYDKVDLRVRHAYSVLDVRIELKDNGDALKLLQLRNPWAQQSWSGHWSDSDYENWYENPRMRSRLNPAQSHHGIFWLCFDDMLKYFDSVDICKTRDKEWAEIRTNGDFPDSASLPPASFFLEVFQSTEIDLSIFQQGSRSQEGSGRHPVDLSICVFRSNEHAARSPPGSDIVLGPLVVCSRRQVKRHGSCCHFFEPGIYQVVTLAFNHWISAFGGGAALGGGFAGLGATAAPTEHPKFVLALHSSRAISLSKFRANVSILADATIELVMKRGEKKEVRECSTCYYLTRGWGGLIVVAENRHPTRYMQVVCDCVDSRNVVSTRGTLKTGDSVPPLHKQVLIVLTQLDGHSGFTITHKLVHRMGYEGLGDWSQSSGNHDPPLTPDVIALHRPRPL